MPKKKNETAEEPETAGDTTKISRGAKAQAKGERLLSRFFGAECEPEIAEDETLTRGAETFFAARENDPTPPGEWVGMAEKDGVILHRRA